MQTQRRGGDTSATHSQPGTRIWMVSTTLRPPYLRGNIQYRLYSETGDSLDFMEDLACSAIRSPDCPSRRESLYRLSFPGRILHVHTTVKMYIIFVSQFYFRGVDVFLQSDFNETFFSSLQFYKFPDPWIS